MIEEIKTDNNCIVKAFENNPIAILQEDINNKKVYCFKASDIGKALKLTNIAQSIQNYDEDEKVLRKAYDLRGCEQDTTFLTSQGVYRLLYNSKKEIAKKFRKWAGNILDDIIFNESTELKKQLDAKEQLLAEQKNKIEEKNEILQKQQNQLNDKQYELEKTQQELKQIEDKKNWLLNRRYNNSKPGDVIYLYKDYKNGDKQCDEFIYKIGKTKNIGEREVEYSNTSKSGKIVYIKYCLNCDLTEKILHHILDKYRLIRNQEWFTFSEELAIQTIESIVYLMDSQMETIDTFIPNLYKLLNINTGDVEILQDDKLPIPIKNENINVNPKDFDKFIQECCELSSEYKYPKADIKQAHRVWSKCSTKDVISALDNYLKNKFHSGVVIENDVKRNVYKGIKLKPLIFNPKDSNNLLDYESFIIEKCKVDWCYRISYVDFFNHFLNWKKVSDSNYKLTHKYKKEIQTYLETVFAGGRVHLSSKTKSTHLFGIWGCGIEFNNFGLKTPERTCKRVCQYNSDTNELIKSWDSLSIASRELGIAISSLSNYCRFSNIVDDYIYKYV